MIENVFESDSEEFCEESLGHSLVDATAVRVPERDIGLVSLGCV